MLDSMIIMCVDVCEIIGSKKDPHQPVEQLSLPQDENEKEVRRNCMCMYVCMSVCMCVHVMCTQFNCV